MTKWKVLAILKEQEDFVSGQTLCQTLGISRNSIWKAVKQLRQDGYDIDAVTNRGYRLAKKQDLLQQEEIKAHLTTKQLGQTIALLPNTASTNKEARRLVESSSEQGNVVLTEQQTAGKGKQGHRYYSAERGLYFSVLWYPTARITALSPCRTAILKTVQQVLLRVCGVETTIQNANQLFVGDKKLCGMLSEVGLEAESEQLEYFIVGIGIYCNNRQFPASLPATSLFLETNQVFDRNHLLATLLNELEPVFNTLG